MTHLSLEEVFGVIFSALSSGTTAEDEKKLLFTLLPKMLARFESDKSGTLTAALPVLSTLLIEVGFPLAFFCWRTVACFTLFVFIYLL